MWYACMDKSFKAIKACKAPAYQMNYRMGYQHRNVPKGGLRKTRNYLAAHTFVLLYCYQPSVHKHTSLRIQQCWTHTHTVWDHLSEATQFCFSSNTPLTRLWTSVDFAVPVFTSEWCRGCTLWRLNRKLRGQGGWGCGVELGRYCTCARPSR